MSRRKLLQINDPISGVITRQGEVVRMTFGHNQVVRLSGLDDKTVKILTRKAKEWMKPPPGSILIHGHAKPPVRYRFERRDLYDDWNAEMY